MKASEIEIPEPCNEDWEGMTPEQRGRFCAACQKKVHDLSAMSEGDATALLSSGEDICVSYLSDASGTVRFAPPRIVPANRLVRRASVASVAGLTLALAACAPHGEGPKVEDTVESSQPAFLEIETIPEVEPCESEPPTAEPEDLVRTKGDYAPPPELETNERRKGVPRRTAGKPIPRPTPDPLDGI